MCVLLLPYGSFFALASSFVMQDAHVILACEDGMTQVCLSVQKQKPFVCGHCYAAGHGYSQYTSGIGAVLAWLYGTYTSQPD